MADVTDSVFRRVIAEIAKPDVFFTEFTSADGLAHEKGREKLLINLKYSELERPVVAQIFGSWPDNIKKAAALCRELGFDGVDINMGCPDRKVEKQGAGAALIKNPDLAREVIDAAREGAPDLPISVKTRLGYSRLDEFPDWFSLLLESRLAAITVHLRTRQEMSKVPAHWHLASQLRELGGKASKLIANGDIEDLADAREKAEKYNLDGVMLGRAIFGNPWLFTGRAKPDWPEVFRVMIYHATLFEETYKGIKNFAIMRKFFGAYVAGHPRASELKLALMSCNSASEVSSVLSKF